MKTVFAILAVCLIAGCSFRDGASTTAASISSGAMAIVGYPYGYDDSKNFWDKKFGVRELPPRDHVVMTGVEEKPIDQNQ